MANEIFNSMNKGNNPFGIDKNSLIQKLQELSSYMGGNPNQIIQEALNSGRVTQEQYNIANQRAEFLRRFFNL